MFFLQSRQFAAKEEKVETVRDDHTDNRLPAEVCEHVPHSPVPDAGHHQNRWRGKMGHGPTHRDIDKQQTDGGVFKILTWL